MAILNKSSIFPQYNSWPIGDYLMKTSSSGKVINWVLHENFNNC